MVSTDDRPPGSSLPASWRNALAWRWAPSMPKQLKGGFLTMLYVAGAMCDPAGLLRFNSKDGRPGRPITRNQLARAAGCDPKDASRYLHAAEAAGVMTVVGARKNGAAPLYTLCMHPVPNWNAAVHSLGASKRKRPTKKPAPWHPKDQGDQGGRSPSVEDSDQGGPAPSVRPQYPMGTEGDRPPTDRGGPAPFDLGGPAPSHSREISRTVSQGIADLGAQGTDRARENAPKNDLSTMAWGDDVPATYSFRAAARARLRGRGEEPTDERVDAYARQLYAEAQAAPEGG